MSGTWAPLATDATASERFLSRALEVRARGGRQPGNWAAEFRERLGGGQVEGRLYVVDGRPIGLASWSRAEPLGTVVHLLYVATEEAEPGQYATLLGALGAEVGEVAFVMGPLAGLAPAVEDAVMHPLGYRRFGRSEMVLADGGVPDEPSLDPGEALRLAERSDLPSLIELHRAAYHGRFDRYLFLDRWDEAEDAKLAVTEILDGRYGALEPIGSWLLHRGERPVGTILSVRTAAGTLIADVAVAPEVQGHGVGRKLLARAVRALRERGPDKIYLNVTEGNDRAERLYARLGFVRSLGPTRDWYNTRTIPADPYAGG